jgi:hypothetical protein
MNVRESRGNALSLSELTEAGDMDDRMCQSARHTTNSPGVPQAGGDKLLMVIGGVTDVEIT